MKTATLEHKINASLPEVYPYFLELEKFGEMHPYMTEVKNLGGNSFSIREKVLMFGFIPMKPFYTAEVVEVEKGKKIVYYAHPKKGVEMKINFYFSESAKNGTTVIEKIEVDAKNFIASLFLNLVTKAHKKLVENLINTTENKN